MQMRSGLKWVIFRWCVVLTALLAATCTFLFYTQFDKEVQRRVESILHEKFPQGKVKISSARFINGVGVQLRKFSLQDASPGSKKNEPALLEADEVLIRFPTNIYKLVTEKPIISEIIFRNASFNVFQRSDHTWSLNGIKVGGFQKSTDVKIPDIHFLNTKIELKDLTDSHARVMVFRNVKLDIHSPVKTSRITYLTDPAQVEQLLKDESSEKNALHSSPSKDSSGMYFPFSGSIETEYSREITFNGRFHSDSTIRLQLGTPELRFSHRLINALPLFIAERLNPLMSLEADLALNLVVATPLKDFSRAQYFLEGKLTEGRFFLSTAETALSEISASFRVGNDGLLLKDASFQFASGTYYMNYAQRGYGEHAPRTLFTRAQDVEFTPRLMNMLPDSAKKILKDLNPSGTLGGEATMKYDGSQWSVSMELDCHDVIINYKPFPYRVDGLRGRLSIQDTSLNFQFATHGSSINISGNFENLGGSPPHLPSGSVRIRAIALPLEERLFLACPTDTRDFLDSLDLRGSVNLFAEYTLPGDGSPMQGEVSLQLLNCATRYREFPFPLKEVCGNVTIREGYITASDIRARNNASDLELSCYVSPSGTGSVLNMNITGKRVVLDTDFCNTLPHSYTKLIKEIQPRGQVDVQATLRVPLTFRVTLFGADAITEINTPPTSSIHIPTQESTPHINIVATPYPEGITVSCKSIPYKIEKLVGTFRYTDGIISLEKFRAVHGKSSILGTLRASISSSEKWDISLENLAMNNIPLDRDLLSIFPENARHLITRLRADGLLSYSGNLYINYHASLKAPLQITWNGEAGIYQGSVDFGTSLTNITGTITLNGSYDGNRMQCAGDLGIDSVFLDKFQFTDVTAPFWFDSKSLIIGGNAESLAMQKRNPDKKVPDTQSKRSLKAKAISGIIYGDFFVNFAEITSFTLHCVLRDGKLQDCGFFTGNNHLKGDLVGFLTLQGNANSIHSLKGNGELHLTNADIYELSAMVSLLKLLSAKYVDRKAFSSGDTRFRIQGRHIYLDAISFKGDAISLIGSGEMNLDRHIKIDFYTVAGHGGTNIPILKPLLHVTGQQMLLITMEGPLENPRMKQEPLPGLNRAFEQIEQEIRSLTPPVSGPNPNISSPFHRLGP